MKIRLALTALAGTALLQASNFQLLEVTQQVDLDTIEITQTGPIDIQTEYQAWPETAEAGGSVLTYRYIPCVDGVICVPAPALFVSNTVPHVPGGDPGKVPEPSTWALGIIGFVLFGVARFALTLCKMGSQSEKRFSELQ